MYPNVHSSTIFNCQDVEATINKWTDKEDVAYTEAYSDIHTYIHIQTYIYQGLLLNHKNEQNFAICNNTDGLGGHYAKRNKSDKDKHCMVSLVCGI